MDEKLVPIEEQDFYLECGQCYILVPVFKRVRATSTTRVNTGFFGRVGCPHCGTAGTSWNVLVIPAGDIPQGVRPEFGSVTTVLLGNSSMEQDLSLAQLEDELSRTSHYVIDPGFDELHKRLLTQFKEHHTKESSL